MIKIAAVEGLYPPKGVQIWYWLETAFGTQEAATNAELGKIQQYSSSLSEAVHRLHGLGEGRNETSTLYGNVDI